MFERVSVFLNRVLRKIFGPNSEEAFGPNREEVTQN